jgi:hypothetical protein
MGNVPRWPTRQPIATTTRASTPRTATRTRLVRPIQARPAATVVGLSVRVEPASMTGSPALPTRFARTDLVRRAAATDKPAAQAKGATRATSAPTDPHVARSVPLGARMASPSLALATRKCAAAAAIAVPVRVRASATTIAARPKLAQPTAGRAWKNAGRRGWLAAAEPTVTVR